MTEKNYLDAIGKATKSLGVFRIEFSRTRCRLARVYWRIENLQKAQDRGEFGETKITETKSGEIEQVDPHIQELDRLYELALKYENALGLTAEALKKLNDGKLTAKAEADDPLAKAFRLVGAG